MKLTECGFRLTPETSSALNLDIEQRRMSVVLGVLKSDAGTFDLADEEKLNTREAGEILGVPPDIVRMLVSKGWLISGTKYNFIKQLRDGHLLRKGDVLKIKPQIHDIIITILKQIEMNRKTGRMKAANTKKEKAFVHAQILSVLNSFPPEESNLYKAALYVKQLEIISTAQFEKYCDRLMPLMSSAYRWMYENFSSNGIFSARDYEIVTPNSEEPRHECMISIDSKNGKGIIFKLFPATHSIKDIIPDSDMKKETISENNLVLLYQGDYSEKLMQLKSWKHPIVTPRVAMRELKKIIKAPIDAKA